MEMRRESRTSEIVRSVTANDTPIGYMAGVRPNQSLLFFVLTVVVTALGIAGGEILRRVVPILYAPLVGGRV